MIIFTTIGIFLMPIFVLLIIHGITTSITDSKKWNMIIPVFTTLCSCILCAFIFTGVGCAIMCVWSFLLLAQFLTHVKNFK